MTLHTQEVSRRRLLLGNQVTGVGALEAEGLFGN